MSTSECAHHDLLRHPGRGELYTCMTCGFEIRRVVIDVAPDRDPDPAEELDL
jgi:hypothetical protein